MPRYVWDRDASALVEVTDAPRAPSAAPMVMRDTPGVKSPIDGKFIEGRADRREHMKRHNVREVDPSEKPKRPVEPAWVGDWRASRGIARERVE
jgi:hypothetical protein